MGCERQGSPVEQVRRTVVVRKEGLGGLLQTGKSVEVVVS